MMMYCSTNISVTVRPNKIQGKTILDDWVMIVELDKWKCVDVGNSYEKKDGVALR